MNRLLEERTDCAEGRLFNIGHFSKNRWSSDCAQDLLPQSVASGLQSTCDRNPGDGDFFHLADCSSRRQATATIAVRIRRLAFGNPGDVKPVGEGISELRMHHGAGYRVYFVQREEQFIVLLCGGDKSTQEKDIAAAKKLSKETA